ncbi:unnamed protein product [Symbiodinium sp. CCMP2592]|nr:unnamed protein product [Symbiodinium sp. CCMP2592]
MGCASSMPADAHQVQDSVAGHRIDWATAVSSKKKMEDIADKSAAGEESLLVQKVDTTATTASGETDSCKESIPEKDRRMSWYSHSRAEDYPVGRMIEPNRKLHDKHVRRLRAFLHDVDAAPFMFKRMVHCKRLHDFGDSYVLDDEVARTHSEQIASLHLPFFH